MIKKLLFLFLVSLQFSQVNSLNSENDLRKSLFQNYILNNRPVLNYSDTVNVSFGVELISLEEFDQVGEKVKFNFHMKYTWYDQYLSWNRRNFDFDYINVKPERVWRPDLELYNSANKPEKVNGEGILKVFHTGEMYWIIPVIYDFTCPLNLDDFPFDTQVCKMTFGSWKLSQGYMNISTHKLPLTNKRLFRELSFDKFSHNEWRVTQMNSNNQNLEYLCCPNELWTVTDIDIVMVRNYHKYIVVIIMTFFLTLSALTVVTFSLEKYIRTYLLVFIPLSIIWLQLYISSKIPVIEHPTKMETFIQLSFYISMISAIYSGIMYNIANSYFSLLGKVFQRDTRQLFFKDKPLTFIARADNEAYRNYYVYKKFNNKLHSIDFIVRWFLLFMYIGYTIFLVY
jgi:hypothetical protein